MLKVPYDCCHYWAAHDFQWMKVSSMRIAVFLNSLGLGGTEKAACRWAWGLRDRGHQVTVLALRDGARRAELEEHGVSVRIVAGTARPVAEALQDVSPDAIHAHAPGHPHDGDVLGAGLALLPKKIPVVQTNIFGHLRNPKEDAWTDFRLFISWTSCVQAARRVFVPLDEFFFAGRVWRSIRWTRWKHLRPRRSPRSGASSA